MTVAEMDPLDVAESFVNLDHDETTDRYQADCSCCGWHTRQVDAADKWWAEAMAKRHAKVCDFKWPPMKPEPE